MTQFPHDHIKPFSDQQGKKQQVGDMFDRIAARYDFMNRFLSAGIDRSWRRQAVRQFQSDQPQHLLDMATGTADMALMAARMLRPRRITGIDLSPKMLEIGRKKVGDARLETEIELLQGDSESIQFPDATFDAAMVAFGVRNFEHLEKGLTELHRVLRPGARLVVLEFSKPTTPGIRQLYQLYMGVIAPQMARLFRQNKKAYQYLNESAKAFPDRGQFVQILQRSGFTETSYKPLTLGICCIYTGRKAG